MASTPPRLLQRPSGELQAAVGAKPGGDAAKGASTIVDVHGLAEAASTDADDGYSEMAQPSTAREYPSTNSVVHGL